MLRVIVEVVFSNDRVAKIKVREGDSPRRLAAEFLKKHCLPSEYEAMLTSQIEQACGVEEEKKKKKKLSSSERQAARSRLYAAVPPKKEEEEPAKEAKKKSDGPDRCRQNSSCERLHREGVDLHRRFEAMKTLLEMEEVSKLKDYKVSEASRKLAGARRPDRGKRKVVVVHDPEDDWTCPKCGYSNRGDATTCARLAKFKETPLAEKCPSAWALTRKLDGASACGEKRPRPHQPTIVSAKSRQMIEAWRRGAERYEWERNRDRHERRRRENVPQEQQYSFKPKINETSEAIVGERRVVEALKGVLEEDATAEAAAQAAYSAALAAFEKGLSVSAPEEDAVHERLYAGAGLVVQEIEGKDDEEESRRKPVCARRQRQATDRLHGEWKERQERTDRARREFLAAEEARREASTILRQSCWPAREREDAVHDALFEERRDKDARRAYLESKKLRETKKQSQFKAGEESKRILEAKRRRCLDDVFDQLVALCAPEELTLEDLASEPVISRSKGAIEACARLTCSDEVRKHTVRALSCCDGELDRESFREKMAGVVVVVEPSKQKKVPPTTDEDRKEEPLPTFKPILETDDSRRPRRRGAAVEDVLRSYSATYAARRLELEKNLRCEAEKELTFRPKITAKAKRRHSEREYPLTRRMFPDAERPRPPPQPIVRADDVSFTEASDLTLYERVSPRAQAPTPTETRVWREDDVDTPVVSSDDSTWSGQYAEDDASTFNIYAAAYHHGITTTLDVGEI